MTLGAGVDEGAQFLEPICGSFVRKEWAGGWEDGPDVGSPVRTILVLCIFCRKLNFF